MPSATVSVQHKNLTFVTDPLNPKLDAIHVEVGAGQRKRELLSFIPAVKEGTAR